MIAVSWFMEHVAGSAIAGLICAGVVGVLARLQHQQVKAHLTAQDEHLAEQDKALAALKGRRR
jgi:hypothetical protein